MSTPTKPDFYYQQSAALPYREVDGELRIMLITTLKRKRWILPKGIVESWMTAWDSAAAEAREEAGVTGEIEPELLGTYEIQKWGGTCKVEVYPLLVTDELSDWPEAGIRQRAWLPLAEALERIDLDGLREIVEHAGVALASRIES